MNNMMFEDLRLHDNILCIDLKSFFASVECKELGYDIFEVPLVVGMQDIESSVTLAATPKAKALGVKSRCRMYEIDPKLRKQLIFVKPSMEKYIRESLNIVSLYLSMFSEEDVYIYSIDECFIDVGPYFKLYSVSTKEEIALLIKNKLYKELGFHVAIGCGPNMLLSKLALDLYSKDSKNNIASLEYSHIQERLWPINKLTDLWSIGPGREKRLHKLGIYTIGDLAQFDVSKLSKSQGVIGEELVLLANGIDRSKVQEKLPQVKRKSIGLGQTLYENYYNDDIKILIKEAIFDLSIQIVNLRNVCTNVTISLGYDNNLNLPIFNRTTKFVPTNNYREIIEYAMELFDKHYIKDSGVRKVMVSLSGLEDYTYLQLNIFRANMSRELDLDESIASLKQKYGNDIIYMAISNLDKANQKYRDTLLGGHRAK
ncbi:MAG: hypothetical protein ACK5HS_02245 [Mycoplasmatales bacterium]